MKRFSSFKTMLSLSDRKGKPVGNLDEITTKAKTIAMDDVDVVTEESDSQYDNGIESVNGEIEQTEDGPAIEEDKNVDSAPKIEEEAPKKTLEPIEEDLTTPEAIMYLDDVPDWDERMDRADYT